MQTIAKSVGLPTMLVCKGLLVVLAFSFCTSTTASCTDLATSGEDREDCALIFIQLPKSTATQKTFRGRVEHASSALDNPKAERVEFPSLSQYKMQQHRQELLSFRNSAEAAKDGRHESVDDTAIGFSAAGYDVQTGYYRHQTPSSPFGHTVQFGTGVKIRVSWLHSTRCSDESCSDCDEQGPCFRPANWAFTAIVPPGSSWSRYLVAIVLKCDHNYLTWSWRVKRLRYGTLHAYLDDVEITPGSDKFNVSASQIAGPPSVDSSYDFPVGSHNPDNIIHVQTPLPDGASEHIFVLELVPRSDRTSEAAISDLYFFMTSDFVDCEDNKACKNELAGNEESWLFGQSTVHKQMCLNDELPVDHEYSEICASWKECLESADDYASRLNLVYDAIGVSLFATNETDLALSQGGTGFSDHVLTVPMDSANEHGEIPGTTCVFPPLEDIEAWTCNCYEGILQHCETQMSQEEGYTIDGCFHAVMCANPTVCQSWKQVSCQGQEESNGESLLEGRALSSDRAERIFEESVGTKACV